MSLKDAIREAVDEREKQAAPPLDLPESSKAVKNASHKTVNTASHKTMPTTQARQSQAISDETAAMTVRVSRRHRLHWLICAKQQGTSLTAAITEALNARFGEPGD